MSTVHLHVSPSPALIDEPLSIQLQGLSGMQQVTLEASQRDDNGQMWRSQATFAADERGIIDVSKMAPLMGSYKGVDAMGLVWSMTPEHGQNNMSGRIQPLLLHLTALVEGQSVATARVERQRVAPEVIIAPVREHGLVANLFLPPGSGSHPAIIVVSGSGGGLSDNRAALYASHGIAALSLAYFNYEGLPAGLVDIPLEYFEKAITWLQANPAIDGTRLAIAGGSRGGELALLLGATFPALTAVVAYVPSGVIWGGFGPGANAQREPAAWTYRGQPLPFMRTRSTETTDALVARAIEQKAPIPLTPGFHDSVDAATALEEVVIPVEKINGPILCISGEDDQMWPAVRLTELAIHRLKARGFVHTFAHLRYPGAGHAIMAPYQPTTINDLIHPMDGNRYALGGQAATQAYANADSWQHVLRFLKAALSLPQT